MQAYENRGCNPGGTGKSHEFAEFFESISER